jgi:NADPH:quinone reductase-like Zn-dependent oxidoreductase
LVRGRQARCADLSLGGRVAESLRANADDRLPLAALGPAQGGAGVVVGRDVADVGPQPSVPHPLDDLTQLATIGLDNEVDRQAIVGPPEARPADGLAIDFVVESDRGQLSEIVQRVRDGRLRTNIGNVATLDDAVAAFNPTERISGKTVIRVRP